jgi:putative flippase GtrA
VGGDPERRPGAAALKPTVPGLPRVGGAGRRGLLRPLAFALVGLANTAVDFGVFLALTRLLGVAPLLAGALGFLVGSVHSYLANGLLTFRDRGARLASAARVLRFAGVTAACLGVSTLVMAAALLVLPDVAAKAVSVLGTFAAGYWLNSRLVYAADAVPQPAAPAAGAG